MIDHKPKIVCPYQAEKNRFALVDSQYPSTINETDVITIVIKDQYRTEFDWFYLLAILNSDLIHYYTKIMNKKVYNLLDYRSNQIAGIPIMKPENPLLFRILSKSLVNLLGETDDSYSSKRRFLADSLIKILNMMIYETYFKDHISTDLLDQISRFFTENSITQITYENKILFENMINEPSIQLNIKRIQENSFVEEICKSL